MRYFGGEENMLPLGQHPHWYVWAPSCANPCFPPHTPVSPHTQPLPPLLAHSGFGPHGFLLGLDARCKVMRIQVPPHFFHLEGSPLFFPGNF